MSIMAQHNYYEEAVRRYENLGHLPNGCKTWKEFCASMQREKEIYFAFRLMEEPPKTAPALCSYFFPQDDVVFGVLTNRDDGKIGRLCIPVSSSSQSLVLYDGFSREDLQLEIDPTNDLDLLMEEHRQTHYRISKIHTERLDVRDLLAVFLHRWIGFDEEATPGDSEADRLLAVRKVFEQFFPRSSRAVVCGSQIAEHLCRLDFTLQGYLDTLRKKLPKEEAKVVALRRRIQDFELK